MSSEQYQATAPLMMSSSKMLAVVCMLFAATWCDVNVLTPVHIILDCFPSAFTLRLTRNSPLFFRLVYMSCTAPHRCSLEHPVAVTGSPLTYRHAVHKVHAGLFLPAQTSTPRLT